MLLRHSGGMQSTTQWHHNRDAYRLSKRKLIQYLVLAGFSFLLIVCLTIVS
jgi:hypothetical protein